MKKKNGKLVVFMVFAFVALASVIAYVVQQRIAANRGKPLEAPAAVSE